MISVKSKTRQGFKNIFFINFKAQQSPPPSVGLLLILWGLFFMVYMISVKSRHSLKVSPLLVCGVDGVIIWCILISVKSVGGVLKVSSVFVYMGMYSVYVIKKIWRRRTVSYFLFLNSYMLQFSIC